jgi:hypothetical protein
VSQHVVIVAVLGLVAAFQRGDRDQLAHEARVAAASGLATSLSSKDRAEQLAAIAAAPHVDAAWWLLTPLAQRAQSRDRRIASTAARSAALIAGELTRHQVIELEISVDLLHERLEAWREVARDRGRWADVRVHAMVTAAEIHGALGRDAEQAPFDLESAAADPEPEVRRAAFELLPAPLPDDLIATVAAHVLDDDPVVALSAAQAVCAGIGLDANPKPLLAALGDAGLARIRALVAAPDAHTGAAVDARRCLAAAGDR